VAEALLAKAPDVVVLTEYHPVRSERLAKDLRKAGLAHCARSEAGYGYQVFIASTAPLSERETLGMLVPEVGGYLEVEVGGKELIIAGVYVPVIRAVPLVEKRRFWSMLHAAASRNIGQPYLVLGDWNTGDFPIDKEAAGRPFSCTPEYRRMKELGFAEPWRSFNGDQP
jgi:exonuclease III